MLPILTSQEYKLIISTRDSGKDSLEVSMDLGKTKETIKIIDDKIVYREQIYCLPKKCKDNTIYYWDGEEFLPVSRFDHSLIKLIPTQWGAPTFQIDGVKMLPSSKICPFQDAKNKVELIKPNNKTILETCGGLGYFTQWCIQLGAKKILSHEINPDVLWIRQHNPWSPQIENNNKIHVKLCDISSEIKLVESNSVDCILHDPPRFALAGDLYSQNFYDDLARCIKKNGLLFHYTGSPNRKTSGRDVSKEVTTRLSRAGFKVKKVGDGLLCQKN